MTASISPDESPRPSWFNPALRIVLVFEWVALLIGVVVAATTPGLSRGLVVAAAILAGVFVATHTLLARDPSIGEGLVLELFVTAGAVLTVGAASLTGGVDSPFVLLALAPTLLAALVSGLRLGLSTSLVSAGLLAGVSIVESGVSAIVSRLGQIALFPLSALLVGQIRSLLAASETRADTLEAESVHTEAELARLNHTNELLRRLTDVYGAGQTTPVQVGRSVLQAIIDAFPSSFATATLFGAEGPVVVARVGTDAADLDRTQFPLGEGETSSGLVTIATPKALSTSELEEVVQLLRPVGVAFANALLLEGIAGSAVREERLRLARELHDEVGPALAALGLALDATPMHQADTAVRSSVSYVREGLGNVVDDLRGIIADLRADPTMSLVTSLGATIGEFPAPPEVTLEVNERRPPRAAAMRQIQAILIEAIRNAYRHAGAASIKVHGTVDRTLVDIEVLDDGQGFSLGVQPEGHYGILGMRERAERIGAILEINSNEGGTSLRLFWKDGK